MYDVYYTVYLVVEGKSVMQKKKSPVRRDFPPVFGGKFVPIYSYSFPLLLLFYLEVIIYFSSIIDPTPHVKCLEICILSTEESIALKKCFFLQHSVYY